MTYVVVTLVVLFFLNIYCSGVSHKLFYQSKEASMIEKCLLASDEISTLEVLNSSTVSQKKLGLSWPAKWICALGPG